MHYFCFIYLLRCPIIGNLFSTPWELELRVTIGKCLKERLKSFCCLHLWQNKKIQLGFSEEILCCIPDVLNLHLPSLPQQIDVELSGELVPPLNYLPLELFYSVNWIYAETENSGQRGTEPQHNTALHSKQQIRTKVREKRLFLVKISQRLVASSDRYLLGLFCFTEEESCGEKLRQCQIKAERDFYLSFLTSFVWRWGGVAANFCRYL